MATDELIKEIRRHLQDDILEYGWLRQIARDLWPEIDPATTTNLVYDSVVSLLESGAVSIGDAKAQNKMVVIITWHGDLEQIKQRLRETIVAVGERPGLGEGFWIETRR